MRPVVQRLPGDAAHAERSLVAFLFLAAAMLIAAAPTLTTFRTLSPAQPTAV